MQSRIGAPAVASVGALMVALVVVVLGSATAALAQQPASDRAPARVTDTLLSAAVTLTTNTGYGSGVLVGSSGVIVTSLHVIQGVTAVSVRLANGDVFDDVRILDVDARRDLAVIKIKAFGLPVVPLGNSDLTAVGDSAYVVGSPRGLTNTLTSGIISAIRDSGDGYRLFQTSAAVSPGSSGGGLFSPRGELVGIVASKMRDAENLNFAVPINYVRGLAVDGSGFDLAEFSRRYPSTERENAVRGPGTDTAKLGRLIAESDLQAEKTTEGWEVVFEGTHADSVSVYIRPYEDIALVHSNSIARRPLSKDQYESLLALSFQRNLVKLGLAGDALVVSADVEMRTLDAPLLERIVDAVASLADDVFGAISDAPAETSYSPLEGPSRARRTATIDLNRGAATLAYERSAWNSVAARGEVPAHYQHVDGGAFFRVIAERIEVPLEKLEEAVLANARQTDPDAQIARRGMRMVNGRSVLVLEIESVFAGVPFVYYGHYATGPFGTVQVIGWTSRPLLEEYRSVFDAVVSGLTVR